MASTSQSDLIMLGAHGLRAVRCQELISSTTPMIKERIIMLKFSLHPSQIDADNSFAPHLVDALEELLIIEDMREHGVPVRAETFISPRDENVTVFWTTDNAGRVATVWEHTYRALTFDVGYGGYSRGE